MSELIINQVHIFLQAAYYGMILGFSYDGLKVFRRIVKHKNFIVSLEDYLFWVVWGIVIFMLIFNYNDGNVRGYVFAALIMGCLLYRISFGRFLVKYTSLILNKIITLVLKKPIKGAKIVLSKMLSHLKKGLVKLNGCVRKKKKEK